MWIQNPQEALPHIEDTMKNIPTGGHPEGYLDRDVLLRGYEIHAEKVRKAVPEGRLLEFSVKDGWEPL